jgi:hypothetical protein
MFKIISHSQIAWRIIPLWGGGGVLFHGEFFCLNPEIEIL